MRPVRQVLTCFVVLYLVALPATTSAQMQASQGSAIVGIVTPEELFLFTDSARSTIRPVQGAESELADLGSQKVWKIGRVIFAQAGLRSMMIRGQEYDFTFSARRMLQSPDTFDRSRFSSEWKAEMKQALFRAHSDDPSSFAQLVRNGVKGIELVVGWFDSLGMPHLMRLYIETRISNDDRLHLEDHDSEIHPTESGRGLLLMAAEAADVAAQLTSDHVTYAALESFMAEGRYEEAAHLIISYAASRLHEVGGPIQGVSLRKNKIEENRKGGPR